MLQAPSHFSRVCGHGHIKKFWLMQTQKESQAYDSKSNLLFAPQTSRPANRGSLKGGDATPRSSTSPLSHSAAFGNAAGTPSKHATLACAQSLSPSPRVRKASSIPSPHYRRASSTSSSLGSSGVESEKEMLDGRFDSFGSYAIAIGKDLHMPVPSPCSQPVNAADEQASRDSDALHTDVVCSKPSPVHTDDSIKQRTFSFTENSADSHSSQISGGIQRLGGHRSLEVYSNQAVKIEGRSSPAQACRDFKFFSSQSRLTTSSSVRDTVEKGNGDVLVISRTQEINHDSSNVAGYMQHPVLKACSLCGTTRTPMWRSGPHGPKSLCNACGIRFKKYRCFPGQESSELLPSPPLGSAVPRSLPRPLKRKQSSSVPAFDPDRSQKICLNITVPDAAPRQQQKKSRLHQLVVERGHGGLKDLSQDRCSPWLTRAGPPSLKKIYGCSPFQSKFRKLMPMDDHLGVNGVFAKDEEEAAVLLMHLSCGLVY